MSVMTDRIPSYWSPMDSNSDSKLVDVNKNSLEYFAVKNHIVSPYAESVTRIQRVQSRSLLQAYLTQKMRMHKSNDAVLNEYLLFHGTRSTCCSHSLVYSHTHYKTTTTPHRYKSRKDLQRSERCRFRSTSRWRILRTRCILCGGVEVLLQWIFLHIRT